MRSVLLFLAERKRTLGQESTGRRTETLDHMVETLLVGLQPKMERILWHYRIPPQDAEDLVQEILISFVRRFDRVQNNEAWLVSALKYQCLLYWRRRRKRLYQAVDSALLDALAEPQPSPAQRYDQAHDLANLLPKIPPRCRKVLELRYGLGMTPKELASKLGYQHSSISNIVRRCLAALTAKLLASEPCDVNRNA